jgi:metallo-beta-lactamase family protein
MSDRKPLGRLSFLGAARGVTGSSYLLEISGRRILIDCGFYQERKFRGRNWDPFPIPPASVDAVLLTHAHLDHCGLLPKLVRDGFKGPIYCTAPTADIAKVIMLDSAKIQEEDVAYKARRHAKEGRDSPRRLVPVYKIEDAEACLKLLKPIEFDAPLQLGNGVEAIYSVAGHILGSAMITVTADIDGTRRSVLFSGDVGRWDSPLVKNPTTGLEADYVICESTYGNREHEDAKSIPGKLADIINETNAAGGNIVIPSFAVERTQEVLYRLSNLLNEDRIPLLPTYLDSPMAIKVTEIFRKHSHLFDADAAEMLRAGNHPCDFPGLIMSRTATESKGINNLKNPTIIIAGSGMCTGGRIKHHLVRDIGSAENTILFVGYQAMGTLGRHILEGADEVRVLGKPRKVEARVEKINGFSGHGDRNELLRWLTSLSKAPKHVYLTHGEPDASESFAGLIGESLEWGVTIPDYLDEVTLG